MTLHGPQDEIQRCYPCWVFDPSPTSPNLHFEVRNVTFGSPVFDVSVVAAQIDTEKLQCCKYAPVSVLNRENSFSFFLLLFQYSCPNFPLCCPLPCPTPTHCFICARLLHCSQSRFMFNTEYLLLQVLYSFLLLTLAIRHKSTRADLGDDSEKEYINEFKNAFLLCFLSQWHTNLTYLTHCSLNIG